jgi:hypothetical protein
LPIFQSNYSRTILMNKLVIEQKYEQVVSIFEKNLKNFTEQTSNSKKTNKDIRNILPEDQLGLAIESLLLIVTKILIIKLDGLLKYQKT